MLRQRELPPARVAGKKCTLVAASTFLLSGCTILRIEAGPDGVLVEREFGALYVSVTDPGRAHAASLISLGIANTPMGFSFGYSRQNWVHMPDDACRLVLWVDDPALLAQVKQLTAEISQVCVVSNSVEGNAK